VIKAQSTIISTILLSGLVLSIVITAYLWAQPLIQKTSDKTRVDSLINSLKTIKQEIDHVQQTGSPSEVSINLQGALIQVLPGDNSVSIKTEVYIPIITSFAWIPIGYTELPVDNKLFFANTSDSNKTAVYLPDGYVPGSTIHFGNITPYSINYNLTVYNRGSYDYVCIYQGDGPVQSDCASINKEVIKDDANYIISWISDNGEQVILSGLEEENKGLFGLDPGGIIIGKGFPVTNVEHIELRLTYRTLVDELGREYKTILNCTSSCRTGEGLSKLRIRRARVEQGINVTNFYIFLSFE